MFQKGLGMLTAEPQELKWGWSKWVARYRALGYTELQFGIVTNLPRQEERPLLSVV